MQIPVIAATPGAIHAAVHTLTTCRLYDDWHQARGEYVAVLGRAAASQLGIVRIDNQPVVFLNDTAYTVIGIIDDVARNPEWLLSVIIPTTTAGKQFEIRHVHRQMLLDTTPVATQLIGHQAPIAPSGESHHVV